MDYLAYLEIIWHYLPHMLYAFVFLTFLPKSFRRILAFASADYEANRNKYHRCYGPELCCHVLEAEKMAKPKQRKVVTRVYPKRKISTGSSEEQTIQRQINPSTIQTNTNVNKMAKMFESGGRVKKINRVIPTILPEIRAQAPSLHEEEENCVKNTTGLEAYFTANQQTREKSQNNQNESEWSSQRRTRNVPNSLSFTDISCHSESPTESSPPASSGSPQSSGSAVQSPVLRSAPYNLKSSLEDIYAAIARNADKQEQFIYSGCNALSPVTSIEDILAQRRLSRPLSAYSISDLLNEEQPGGLDEAYVSNFLRTLNTTRN